MTTKRKPTANKKSAKKAPTRKQSAKRKTEPHPYVMPKTAAELRITCLSPATVAGGKGSPDPCGAPVIWFDYELGEKEFYRGFVCDEHKISTRIEKLAQPTTT
jgi:hypothetical protein